MKKTLLSATLAMTLGLSTSLMASESDKYVYAGIGYADIMNEGTPMYKLGFGGERTFDNNIMLGADIAFSYASVGGEDQSNIYDQQGVVIIEEDSNFVGMDFSLLAGYQVMQNMDVYGSVGYMFQSVGSDDSARGVGFGGGVSYKLHDNFAVAAQYKTYDMETTDSNLQYDMSVTELQLRYVY